MQRYSKKVKQICLVVAFIFMSTAILPGCVKKPAESAAPAQSSTVKAATVAEETKEQLPEVNLTWYMIGAPQKDIDAVLAEANKTIKSKINATLTQTIIDWGNYDQKIKVIQASGDPFDICFTSSWANDYYGAVSKGAIIPINELLDKYGKAIKAAIPEKFWNAAKVKGKIYGVLNYQMFAMIMGYAVKKELADKYKFDYTKVKKCEDMEPFFEQVKNNEPGVTPLAIDTNGIMFYNNLETGYSIESITGGTSPCFIRNDDKEYKVFNGMASKEVMDYFKLMRSWYKKGYVRKDAVSIKDWRSDFNAGKYAAYIAGNIKPGNAALESNASGFEVVDIPITIPFITTGTIIATMNGISRTSKNPERAMMLLDLLYSDKDLYNLMVFGIKDKHYKKIDADFVEPIKDSGYEGIAWELGNQFNAYYTKGQSKDDWEATIKLNEDAVPYSLLGFNYDPEHTKADNTQIDATMAEYIPGLTTGTLDPEKAVPQLLDKMSKAGIDKIITEAQRQIDQWRKD